jgi:hypothetical protein
VHAVLGNNVHITIYNRLEALFDKIPSHSTAKEREKIKWSDIVAGRKLSVPEYIPSAAQGIETDNIKTK